MATRTTIGFDNIEFVGIDTDTNESTPLSARIKAEHSKVDNRAERIASLSKGDVERRYKAQAVEALRKDAAHLACVPDSPEAKALWEDEVEARASWVASNPDKEVTIKTPGTGKPYYVWLARGTESAARMWSMTRLVEAGASLDDVYFIHEELLAQYKGQVLAHNALLAELKG